MSQLAATLGNSVGLIRVFIPLLPVIKILPQYKEPGRID